MRFFYLFFLLLIHSLFAEDYVLGQGYTYNENLTVGAYFATDYTYSDTISQGRLDDVAVLGYGKVTRKVSYFLELEAVSFYVKDFKTNTSQKNMKFHYERAYFNYNDSNSFNYRLGKFIAPIGYWNLTPINVLRDTSSNPLLSFKMFPKFVTGLGVYGYTNEDNDFEYHIFAQITDDLDEEYSNIKTELFTGASVQYFLSDTLDIGSTLGYYEKKYEKKDILLSQVNARYDNYPFLLQTEWAYTDIDNTPTNTDEYQLGGYLQGMYNLTEEHAIVSRYEYFKDTQATSKSDENIVLFGYSYRPLDSVSFKVEYQIYNDSRKNISLASFSVLF